MAEQPGLDLEVLYCHRATAVDQATAGFGVEFGCKISSVLEEFNAGE